MSDIVIIDPDVQDESPAPGRRTCLICGCVLCDEPDIREEVICTGCRCARARGTP
jgi:hypothetical protein